MSYRLDNVRLDNEAFLMVMAGVALAWRRRFRHSIFHWRTDDAK
jgi:hypothetical protein